MARNVPWGTQEGSDGWQLFGLMPANISDFSSAVPGLNPDDHGTFLLTGWNGGLTMSAGDSEISSMGVILGLAVV